MKAIENTVKTEIALQERFLFTTAFLKDLQKDNNPCNVVIIDNTGIYRYDFDASR